MGCQAAIFCQSSLCASVEFTVQAMNHSYTEGFPGAHLPSHLGCAFWAGNVNISTIQNSQVLPACANRSPQSCDYSPSRLVTSEALEKHLHMLAMLRTKDSMYPPRPAKKIKAANIQTPNSEQELTMTHFTKGCLSSLRNSIWGHFKYQVSLRHLTVYKILI